MVTDTMISTPMQEREGTMGVVGVEIGYGAEVVGPALVETLE
jgi:hypothetical protein